MNERQEEQAALQALRMLESHESRILESEMVRDAKLKETLVEFEDAVGQLATLLPAETPPADLKAQLMSEVKRRRRGAAVNIISPFQFLKHPAIGWAAAALIMLATAGLWTKSKSLEERVTVLTASETSAQNQAALIATQIKELKDQVLSVSTEKEAKDAEIAKLKQSNALARMEVATLKSNLSRYEDGVAVIVWDSEKQEGKLKLDKMPPVQANKDYQLWVVDKKDPTAPVSAGVVKLSPDGSATMTFHPVEPISKAAAFALSVESLGGVPQKSSDGPIVLIGP
jgi:anti-sigma-K factor RskA